MSDVGLGATLQLEIADALARIDQLASTISAALTGVPLTIADPDASNVTTAIDTAVQSADSTVVATADAGEVTAGIDSAVQAADGTVVADADTTGVTASIDAAVAGADGTVAVDADTAPAEDAIQALIATASDAAIDVPITADTSQAEDAISALGDTVAGVVDETGSLTDAVDQLGASAGGTKGSVSGLGDVTNLLSTGSSLAQGNVSGLGDAVSGISPAAAGAVGGITALAGATALFFDSGLKAVEADERLTRTFGPLADAVKNVHVGDLTGDLDHLAASLGTNTVGLEDAATKIGLIGQSSGASNPRIAETADNILALSLRVRALNPSLGESGDIAERVFTALGKGGRGLATFNLTVDQAAVKQEALRENVGKSEDQLTKFDLQAAASTVLIQKYGSSLAEVIAGGANDPTIRLARIRESFTELRQELGREVVVPVLDLLEALQPIGQTAVTIIGAIVTGLGPLLTLIGQLAGPLSAIAGGLASVNPGLLQMVTGIGLLGAGIALSLPELTSISLIITGVAVAVGGLIHALDSHSGPSKEFQDGVKASNAALADGSKTVQQSTGELISNGVAAGKLPPVLGLLGKSYEEIAGAVIAGGTALKGLTTEINNASIAQALAGKDGAEFVRQLEKAGGSVSGLTAAAAKGKGPLEDYLKPLLPGGPFGKSASILADVLTKATTSTEDLRKETQIAAETQLTAAVANGEIASSYLDAAKASGNYAQALQDGREAAQLSADATLSAKVATGELTIAQYQSVTAAATAANGTVDYVAALSSANDALASAADAQDALNAHLDALAVRLPDVGSALHNVGDDTGWLDLNLVGLVDALSGANVSAADLDLVAQGLGVTSQQLSTFIQGVQGALKEFTQTAVDKLPSVGDAFTAAAKKADDAKRPLSAADILKALQENNKAVRDEVDNLQTLVSSKFADLAGLAAQQGPQFVKAFADSVRAGDTETLSAFQHTLLTSNVAFDDLKNLLDRIGPDVAAHSGEIAAISAQAFGDKFVLTDPVTGQLTQLGALLSGGQPPIDGATVLADNTVHGFLGTFGPGLSAATQTGIDGVTGILSGSQGGLTQSGTETGGSILTGFVTGIAPLPDETQTGIDGVSGVLHGAQQPLAGLGSTAGSSVLEGFVTGINPLPGKAGKAVTDSGPKISSSAKLVAALDATAAGGAVGTSFSLGIPIGMLSRGAVSAVESAARAIIRKAKDAAMAEAKAASPSKVFIEIGEFLTQGLAVGITKDTSAVAAAAENLVTVAADKTRDAIAAATAAGQSALAHGLDIGGNVPTSDIAAAFKRAADATDDKVVVANLNLAHALEALLEVQQQGNSLAAGLQQEIRANTSAFGTVRQAQQINAANPFGTVAQAQEIFAPVVTALDGVTAAIGDPVLVAQRFTGAGFSPAQVQAQALTPFEQQIQLSLGPFTFSAGTKPEDAQTLVDTSVQSAIDVLRRNRAVAFTVKVAG